MDDIDHTQTEQTLVGPGWVIAIVGGRAFVGRSISGIDPEVLSPCYELQAGIMLQPQPGSRALGMQRQCIAQPPLGFQGLCRLEIPDGAIIWNVDSLSPSEVRDLQEAVGLAENMVQTLRATAAGIVTAQAFPGGPGGPGGPGRGGPGGLPPFFRGGRE